METLTNAQAVIDRLERMSKQGESYDAKGRHGWRNPIRRDTGPLLEALVIANQPDWVLEIGTAHGLSGCYIGRNLPRTGRMVSIEWDQATAQEAQANFNEAGLSVEVRSGDAMKLIPNLGIHQFNMVFLDGNKDGYLEQIQALIKGKFLAPACLIVADNVIDRQAECQNFLDFMKDYRHMIVHTECGLLVGVI